MNRAAHTSSELGAAVEVLTPLPVVTRHEGAQSNAAGGLRMRFALLEPGTSLCASLILLIALVIGALGCDACAGEGGLNSRSNNRYKIPGDGDAAVIPVVVGGQSRPFIIDTGSRITVEWHCRPYNS